MVKGLLAAKPRFLTACQESDTQSSRPHFFFEPVPSLPVSASLVAFRAFPQAEALSFRHNLSQIHRLPINGAGDARRYFPFDGFYAVSVDEVSTRAIVSDRTARLSTGVQHPLRRLT